MKKAFLLIIGLLIFGCQSSQDSQESTEAIPVSDQQHEHEEGQVELTNVQIANIGIQFAKLESRKIRSLVKLNGRVELPPNGKAVASSPLSGIVNEVYVIPGQEVRKGQKLFDISNLELIEWQQNLLSESARIEYLEKEIERQKALVLDEISPQKNVEILMAELKKCKANHKGIQAQLDLVGIQVDEESGFQHQFSIYATQSGITQHLNISKGEHINANTVLVEILNDDHLHLHLTAYGNDIMKLSKEQQLIFFIQSRPDDIRKAEILWINNIVDESNNGYDVHAEIIDGNAGLKAGEYVEARVISEEEELLTLPLQAVTHDQGLHYIFTKDEVVEHAMHFNKVQVDLGEQDLGYVEILPIDPLAEDSEVVIEGAFFLMAQSKKGEGGGGHEH